MLEIPKRQRHWDCIPEVRTENKDINNMFLFKLQIMMSHEANNTGDTSEDELEGKAHCDGLFKLRRGGRKEP